MPEKTYISAPVDTKLDFSSLDGCKKSVLSRVKVVGREEMAASCSDLFLTEEGAWKKTFLTGPLQKCVKYDLSALPLD